MPKVTVIQHDDLWRPINSEAKVDSFEMNKMPFKFTVDIPQKAYDKCDKDPLLQQKIWDPATELYKKMVKEMAAEAKKTDKKILQICEDVRKTQDLGKWSKDYDKAVNDFKAAFQSKGNSYAAQMEKACIAEWDKYCKLKTDLKKFKIKMICENVFRGVAIGLNTAKLVLTLGTDVFAWQGLVKDATKMVVDITRMGRNLDGFQETIVKDLISIQKDLNGGKKKTVAKEATGAVLAVLVGHTCLKTALNTGKMLKVHIGRVDLLDKHSHTVAKKIQKALTEIEAEKSKWSKVKEVYDSLNGGTKDLTDLAEKVSSLQQRIKKYRAFHTAAKTWISDITTKTGTGWLDDAVKIGDTVTSLAKSAVGGAAADWSDMAALGMRIAGWTNNVGKMVIRHKDQVKKLAAKKAKAA